MEKLTPEQSCNLSDLVLRRVGEEISEVAFLKQVATISPFGARPSRPRPVREAGETVDPDPWEFTYQQAVSALLYRDMHTNPHYRAFVDEHLKGEVFRSLEDARSWLEGLIGPAQLTPPASGSCLVFPWGKPYTWPPDPGPLSFSLPSNLPPAVDDLVFLIEHFASRFGWTQIQAAAAILTNAFPLRPLIEAAVVDSEIPRLRRLSLSIDPVMSPQEVAKAYAAERSKHFGKPYRHSQKHLMLAEICAQRFYWAWRSLYEFWDDAYGRFGTRQYENSPRKKEGWAYKPQVQTRPPTQDEIDGLLQWAKEVNVTGAKYEVDPHREVDVDMTIEEWEAFARKTELSFLNFRRDAVRAMKRLWDPAWRPNDRSK